jgi:hypothetical protein
MDDRRIKTVLITVHELEAKSDEWTRP